VPATIKLGNYAVPASSAPVLVAQKRSDWMRRKLGKVAMRDCFWARLCPHRRHEGLDAHDVHNAGEIVSQYVQRHLSGNPGQRLHQEVRGSHPGLNRAEGMLDRLASLAHLFRMLIEPALNDFKNVLMLKRQ